MINFSGILDIPIYKDFIPLNTSLESVNDEYYCSKCEISKNVVICNGSCLNLHRYQSNTNILLEFDNDITAVCWDPKGTCLIISDLSNNLHFINEDGTLLFSYSSLTKSIEARIISIVFMESSTSVHSSLLISFSNGLVIEISKVPISSISEMFKTKPQLIVNAISSLNHSKCTLPVQSTKNINFFMGSDLNLKAVGKKFIQISIY